MQLGGYLRFATFQSARPDASLKATRTQPRKSMGELVIQLCRILREGNSLASFCGEPLVRRWIPAQTHRFHARPRRHRAARVNCTPNDGANASTAGNRPAFEQLKPSDTVF